MTCNLCDRETKPQVIICADCVNQLVSATDERIYALLNKLKDKALFEKIALIERFTGLTIEDKEIENERKTHQIRPDLVRKRPGRQIRPARYKVRA